MELKEDRSLFARMMLACKSRPEIDIKDAIGTYEFSVVPRSLFAADGTMLHCSQKSVLMEILEKLPPSASTPPTPTQVSQTVAGSVSEETTSTHDSGCQRKRVDIVDGMAEVQILDKPKEIQNCSDLADHFATKILHKYSSSDELHLVFDRYDISLSLKMATRVKRQGGHHPVSYHITDTTNIAKLPMKRLLSHSDTKAELSAYFAERTLRNASMYGKNVVVAWSTKCRATHRDMSHLQSDQEEADTKLLLHALDAASSGATSIKIHSPDTDVLFLHFDVTRSFATTRPLLQGHHKGTEKSR